MKRSLILLLSCIIILSFVVCKQQPVDQMDWKEDNSNKWFEQKLDHFDMQNNQTFKTRYWVNYDHWLREGDYGPLILYLCGEWTCSNQRKDGYVFSLAKKYKALLVVHEHRYYGMSQPFDDWSTENLRWLNTDQALADVAYFATSLSEEFSSRYNIPQKRWLVIGGSYPGALVSWFRNKYPHIAFGAWSSSGVVDAVQDFHQFDEQVTASMMKSGSWCPEIVRNLIVYTNTEFDQGRGDAIKAQFNATSMPDDEFYWFYSDVIAETVQYGGRTELCQRVKELDGNWTQMNQMINDWQVGRIVGRDDYWSAALVNTTIDYGKNGRQWTYQYCSELGYLQTPAQKYPPLKNDAMNLTFWKNYCSRIFKRETFPDTYLWNLRYGGKAPSITNVIYMNGEEDPWKQAGILKYKGDKSVHTFELKCDNCAHCIDLNASLESPPKAIAVARSKSEKIVQGWINTEKLMESLGIDSAEKEIMSVQYLLKQE